MRACARVCLCVTLCDASCEPTCARCRTNRPRRRGSMRRGSRRGSRLEAERLEAERRGEARLEEARLEAALLKARLDSEEDSRLCVICMERPKTHMLSPCGHKCLCEVCSQDLMARRNPCPMCRGPPDSCTRVWD